MHYFYIVLAELRWNSSRTRATCFRLRMRIISAASDLSAACMWFTDRYSHRPHDIHTSRDIHLPFLIAHEAASCWCSTLSSFCLLWIIGWTMFQPRIPASVSRPDAALIQVQSSSHLTRPSYIFRLSKGSSSLVRLILFLLPLSLSLPLWPALAVQMFDQATTDCWPKQIWQSLLFFSR